jgi:hypothetical protein
VVPEGHTDSPLHFDQGTRLLGSNDRIPVKWLVREVRLLVNLETLRTNANLAAEGTSIGPIAERGALLAFWSGMIRRSRRGRSGHHAILLPPFLRDFGRFPGGHSAANSAQINGFSTALAREWSQSW